MLRYLKVCTFHAGKAKKKSEQNSFEFKKDSRITVSVIFYAA